LEREPDNLRGLRTPYTTGFTPQSQEPKSSEILLESLFNHCLLIH